MPSASTSFKFTGVPRLVKPSPCATPSAQPRQPSSSSPFVPGYYISLLDRCTELCQLKQIQAPLAISGLHSNPFLLGKLVEVLTIRLHGQQHALPYALHLFSHSHQPPNLFTWNTLIRALSLSATPRHALLLFAQMLRTPSAAPPDAYSFAFALKACARLQAHEATKAVHAIVVVTGPHSDSHAVNTLMHAYASCGDVAAMDKLFRLVPCRDVVGWNVMLTGCVQNSLPNDALKLLQTMLSSAASVAPTDVTMIAALSACSQTKDLCLGRQIHGRVCKMSMLVENGINMGTSLIDMYAKCSCLGPAEQVFDEMRAKDVGVWNALLGGYVHNGHFIKALQFFEELQESGLTPDGPTLVSALTACGNASMLDAGKSIHAFLEDRNPRFDAVSGTALIEMYSKCGCIDEARRVFDKMPKRDAMAWSSMIGCLAVHGHSRDALELFASMRRSGARPDAVTFMGVLSACSHVGLLDEGMSHFKSMSEDFGIAPRIEHYGCVIDLLSRAGRVREALEMMSSIEGEANAIVWRSILSACRTNLDIEAAEIAVEKLARLRSEHCGDRVLLSNIYAAKGRWDDARRVRKTMKESRIRKKPAFSLIDSGDRTGI